MMRNKICIYPNALFYAHRHVSKILLLKPELKTFEPKFKCLSGGMSKALSSKIPNRTENESG